MRNGLAALAGALTLAAAGSAAARDIPNTGMSIADVVSWLQADGYQAQVVTGSNGKQHVKSAADGVSFGVYMFDCQGDNCGSVQFAAGWNTHGTQNAAQVAAWNKDKRWARAYLDASNDPWLEMDVDITPGGTYELLNDDFATWRKVLNLFATGYLTK